MEDITAEVDAWITADTLGVHFVECRRGKVAVPRGAGVRVHVESPEDFEAGHMSTARCATSATEGVAVGVFLSWAALERDGAANVITDRRDAATGAGT